MLKVIIILILIGYVFYRVTALLFSGLFGGFHRRHFGQGQSPYSKGPRKAPNSNLNIDNIPSGKSQKGDHYSGGEYVDYEEVK